MFQYLLSILGLFIIVTHGYYDEPAVIAYRTTLRQQKVELAKDIVKRMGECEELKTKAKQISAQLRELFALMEQRQRLVDEIVFQKLHANGRGIEELGNKLQQIEDRLEVEAQKEKEYFS